MALAYSSASGHVAHDQRHTRFNPCPVCQGGEGDKRGRGIRCWGFTSADGRWATCTNDDYAGALIKNPRTQGYTHLLDGACKCGETHGDAPRIIPGAVRKCETPQAPTRAHLRATPTAIYAYRTVGAGEPLRKLRYGSGKSKYFVWQRPDGAGDWLDGRNGAVADAYRADTLATADPFGALAIAEGEKCAEAMARVGWEIVISPPDGAGSWSDAYNAYAAGRQVVIFADDDERGAAHALDVAQRIAPYALSVRIVSFSDAHDVGDWLDMGHTLDALRTLAAQTPIITACQPQSQNPCPTPQDGTPSETLKSCPNCQQWHDRARIAETSLTNIRKEQAMAARILAMPKEQLSPSLKPAAIAVRNVLTRPKARDDEGMEQVYRAEIARQCGVSDKTAGAYLRDLAQAGIIRREVSRSFDTSEIKISEGPLFDAPEQVATQPKTWGGKRVKVCVACGSDNLETRVVCRTCGTLQSAEDTNKPDGDPDGSDAPALNNSPLPQDGTPCDASTAASTSPSGNTYVAQLDADVQEDACDELLWLAEWLDWPRIPLDLQHIIGGNAPAWRDFAASASPDDLATIHYRLMAKHAALSGGDKE